MDEQSDQRSEQEMSQYRDDLLLRLLKTPPQPRPKRERGKKKPTRTRASCASAKNALAFCLGVRGFTRLLIKKPLTFGTFQ